MQYRDRVVICCVGFSRNISMVYGGIRGNITSNHGVINHEHVYNAFYSCYNDILCGI
jgi:hypothetical protein